MRYFLLLSISSVLFACTQKEPIEYSIEAFPNVLDIQNQPDSINDWASFSFFDKGSWFGFALPEKEKPETWGGFTGPFLTTQGQWMSQQLIKTTPSIAGEAFNADSAKSVYLPGRLVHTCYGNGVEFTQTLIFVSKFTALIKLQIKNLNAKRSTDFRMKHAGELYAKNSDFTLQQGGKLKIWLNDSHAFAEIAFSSKKQAIPKQEEKTSFSASDYNYTKLAPSATHTEYISISFFTEEKEQQLAEKDFGSFDNASAQFTLNRNRWQGYLNKVVNTKAKYSENKAYRRIAVKSLLTLVNNWKSAKGHLYHDGVFPSYAVEYFNGFWAWDSWKHAVAVAIFNQELAKEQIRTMFRYTNPQGMVYDCVYADSTENNKMNTKAPLAAWAVWAVFKKSNDTSFVAEMYPALRKYHYWWYRHRDNDQNGLCEYGATVNKKIAAKWESGMDNAVRFDNIELLKNNKTNWSMNLESVDLNAYLYLEKVKMAQIAKLLGKEGDRERFNSDSKSLQKLINSEFFDSDKGYFFDKKIGSNKLITTFGPEGWTPLWTKAATQNQAKQVAKILTDTAHFATYVPFPTVSKSDPNFSTGYWRGTVWLDQVYFAISGLRKYEFNKEADQFTLHIFNRLQGLKGSAPIRENYWPIDGKGIRVNHFSWSAAHLLLLYQNN